MARTWSELGNVPDNSYVYKDSTGNYIGAYIPSSLPFHGTILIPSDFPTLADVMLGWTYFIGADVTDDDPTKTNTGQSFTTGQQIAWNGTGWSDVTPASPGLPAVLAIDNTNSDIPIIGTRIFKVNSSSAIIGYNGLDNTILAVDSLNNLYINGYDSGDALKETIGFNSVGGFRVLDNTTNSPQIECEPDNHLFLGYQVGGSSNTVLDINEAGQDFLFSVSNQPLLQLTTTSSIIHGVTNRLSGVIDSSILGVLYGSTILTTPGEYEIDVGNGGGSGVTNITLAGSMGTTYIIKDFGCACSSNHIVLHAGPGNVIIGNTVASTYTMSTNGQSVVVKKIRKVDWAIISDAFGASSAGGTIGGTIASNQIAYGTSLDSIAGNHDFIYNPSSQTLSVGWGGNPWIEVIAGSTNEAAFGNLLGGNTTYLAIDDDNQVITLSSGASDFATFDALNNQWSIGYSNNGISLQTVSTSVFDLTIASNSYIHFDVSAATFVLGTPTVGNLSSIFWDDSARIMNFQVGLQFLFGNGSSTILEIDQGAHTISFTDDATSFIIPTTITPLGTDGDVTIDKMSGKVNFAAAGGPLTVTNALVTADSKIFVTIETVDLTMTSIQAVTPASGSFLITPNAAPTAEVTVSFVVFN